MQNLLPEGDWAMAAILGLEDEKWKKYVKSSRWICCTC